MLNRLLKVAPQLLNDWQQGNWHPGLCELAWQQVEIAPGCKALYTALKIQNAIAGIQASHVNYAIDVSEELDCCWHAVTHRLISSCLQVQREDLACHLLEKQLKGAVTPIRYYLLSRNPSVLSLLHKLDPARLPWRSGALARCANSLMANSRPLNHQLLATLSDPPPSESAVTVAIVGNSPALLERADGQDIDSHEVVIRFNSAHLNEQILRHTGTKTSLLVLSPAAARTMSRVPVQPLAISGVSPWHNNSRYWRRFAALEEPTHHIPSPVWHSLVARLNAPPSSGLLALACLSQESLVRVRAYGLTNSEQFCTATQGLHYGDTKPPSSRHNWKLEAELVSEMTDSHKT